MSKNSGVTGKTVPQLSRANAAEGRKVMREARSSEKQLRELDLRPGRSARERARLEGKR